MWSLIQFLIFLFLAAFVLGFFSTEFEQAAKALKSAKPAQAASEPAQSEAALPVQVSAPGSTGTSSSPPAPTATVSITPEPVIPPETAAPVDTTVATPLE